ncbi:hypothetical protein [Sphingobacterium faecale]|uniref:HTH cro/C1-type domain-containing protein n=1 Tax=Sphingobacterium faecale TaxID=2803775 RepID=A0ABS1R9V9_9SPHI|nr:hypothetical protein [Sphingobacterium faecale]MBL1410782.1 hypothetical protein [Sphingobacterium faecale]
MTLGKFIQERVRLKGITDKAVAEALHISARSVPNIYSAKEIPTSRVALLSVLLNEDIYYNYYKNFETVAPVVSAQIDDLIQKIKTLENTIFDKERLIQSQAALIESLQANK